jgi:hypothetical protein
MFTFTSSARRFGNIDRTEILSDSSWHFADASRGLCNADHCAHPITVFHANMPHAIRRTRIIMTVLPSVQHAANDVARTRSPREVHRDEKCIEGNAMRAL